MSHTSASSYLVWAVALSLFFTFFLYHLYRFDQFRCLRWGRGNSGAFKRLMTYSYTLGQPLILTFALGFAVIKYKEGVMFVPPFGVIPKPWQLWTPMHQKLIFPLQLIWSVGWSTEMVTHLEELCFWLYLMNQGPSPQDWFKSPYFKTWVIGAIIAVTYMPLIAIFTRHDPLRCEAFTFLAGSLGSLSLTLWFIPILFAFPKFLRALKQDDVDQGTIVRLTKFHELNVIRVLFRFLMVVPLAALGADGLSPHIHLNTSPFWTDLLIMLSSYGWAVSSGITLVIFFPRSIEGEVAVREQARQLQLLHQYKSDSLDHASAYSTGHLDDEDFSNNRVHYRPSPSQHPSSQGTPNTATGMAQAQAAESGSSEKFEGRATGSARAVGGEDSPQPPPFRPNRLPGRYPSEVDSRVPSSRPSSRISVNNTSALHNFRSPIDFAYQQQAEGLTDGATSRLTFNRR